MNFLTAAICSCFILVMLSVTFRCYFHRFGALVLPTIIFFGFPSEKQFSTLRHLIKIVLWFYFLFLLLFRYFFFLFFILLLLGVYYFSKGDDQKPSPVFLLYIYFLFTNIETKGFFSWSLLLRC
uniref:Uncharacterized protein n=1 Tax=Phlegmariurus squarrosus TaxID=73615 RepID=H9M8A3_PHLSQ|nr:hypothetical protein HusqMp147 [Phlegmariurus squarrosus]AEV55810.1 hypothetical protein HusqMp147 [Phlegmariurus squarrosus]